MFVNMEEMSAKFIELGPYSFPGWAGGSSHFGELIEEDAVIG